MQPELFPLGAVVKSDREIRQLDLLKLHERRVNQGMTVMIVPSLPNRLSRVKQTLQQSPNLLRQDLDPDLRDELPNREAPLEVAPKEGKDQVLQVENAGEGLPALG